MIKQIELKNYKSYDRTVVNFKPVTILCGGNSSGKTAIIKSILLMKQSFEATGNNYLLINGPYTNNGLYKSTRKNNHIRENDTEMGISVSFEIERENPSFKEICRSMGMIKHQSDISSINIDADFQFEENAAMPQVGEIASCAVSVIIHYNDDAACFAKESVVSKILMTKGSYEQQYSIVLEYFPTPLYTNAKNAYPFEYLDHLLENCTCYFRGMQLVSLYKEQLSKKTTSVLPVLYTIFRVLAFELDKVAFIGPLREAPMRQYFLQDVYSDIGVKGENTAHYLGQFGTHMIRAPLPNKPTLRNVSLNEAVSQWAVSMGIEEVSVKTTDIPGAKLTQIMIGKQNIVDVGFGVSQVLPILVEGLTLGRGSTLILEQPEIHLHPKMQMDIADFLIMIAQQGKNLIVETHSDHIINRIVRRAVEDESLREMIGIYFVEKDQNGNSRLSEVQIHEDLGIDEAPQGFFDQYASETELILQAGYRNMLTKRRDKK